MTTRTKTEADAVLHGRLDVQSVAEVRVVLHAAVDGGSGDVVIDVSDVDLVDATGLGVLVGAHRRAVLADRRLVLRGAGPRLMRILRVTRLQRVLLLEDGVDADQAGDSPVTDG